MRGLKIARAAAETTKVVRRGLGSSAGGGGRSVKIEAPPKTFASAATREQELGDELPAICRVPLNEAPPGLPRVQHALAAAQAQPSQISVFDNGLRVASEPRFGEFCTLGVMVDVGSRYEPPELCGATHFLEKLAFNSSEQFGSRDDVAALLERFGGMVDCQATRDTLVYAASCHVSGLDAVTRLLADVALRPRLTADEVRLARAVVRSDAEALRAKPEPDELLQDLLHAAAFGHNTLGLPKMCPEGQAEALDASSLKRFHSTHFRPRRMVVAGVGVGHQDLFNACRRHFTFLPPAAAAAQPTTPSVDQSTAQFTGGVVTVEKDLSAVGLAAEPFPELAHVALGLAGAAHADERDFVPFCVLQALLGGGGSFSAGGPGKGMYTRLYLRALNRHHWLYAATCFNLAYQDAGLFYVQASAPPAKVGDALAVVLGELIGAAGEVEKGELGRAKRQLQSMLLMNLEQRPVVFEDLSRQVLARGERRPPGEVLRQIDAVNAADVQRVAERMLASKAALAAYGTLARLPDPHLLDKALAKRDPSLLLPQSFFSWRR